MNVFLVILLCIGGVVHEVWAQDNKKTPETKMPEITAEEKAFLQDLEKLKDPFLSPFAKKVVEEVKPPVPAPVETPQPVPSKLPEPKPTPPPRPTPVPVVLPVELNVAPFSTGGIKVNGIIWNTDLPQAIVNDSVVNIGDELQGAKIVSIKKEGIELLHRGKKYYLSINEKPNEPSNVNRGPFSGSRRQ